MHLWTLADEERREIIRYEAWTLRAACDARRIKLTELAAEVGIPVDSVRNYLSAHRGMREQVITTLAAALDVDIDPLLVPRRGWEERYGKFMCMDTGVGREKPKRKVPTERQSKYQQGLPLRKCHTAGCTNLTTDFWCKECKKKRAAMYGYPVEEMGQGTNNRTK